MNKEIPWRKLKCKIHLHPTSNSEGLDITYDDASYRQSMQKIGFIKKVKNVRVDVGECHVVSKNLWIFIVTLSVGDKVHMTITNNR